MSIDLVATSQLLSDACMDILGELPVVCCQSLLLILNAHEHSIYIFPHIFKCQQSETIQNDKQCVLVHQDLPLMIGSYWIKSEVAINFLRLSSRENSVKIDESSCQLCWSILTKQSSIGSLWISSAIESVSVTLRLCYISCSLVFTNSYI